VRSTPNIDRIDLFPTHLIYKFTLWVLNGAEPWRVSIVEFDALPLDTMSISSLTSLATKNDLLHRPSDLRRGVPFALISTGKSTAPLKPKSISTGDSSDDEGSAPLLSAESEELLGVRVSTSVHPSLSRDTRAGEGDVAVHVIDKRPQRESNKRLYSATPDHGPSPSTIRAGSPRIVRLNATSAGSTTLKRAASTSSIYNGSPRFTSPHQDIHTPAPRPRKAQARATTTESKEPAHSGDIHAVGSGERLVQRSFQSPEAPASIQETIVPVGLSTANRSKTEEVNAHSSLRIKRVGKVTGRFLSGPARRGFIRRQSDDEQSPLQDIVTSTGDPKPIIGPKADQEQESTDGPFRHGEQAHASSVRVIGQLDSISAIEGVTPAQGNGESLVKPHSLSIQASSNASSTKRPEPIFKVPPLPTLPSRHDQENEPPPTFKRNKSNGLDLLEMPQKFSVMDDGKALGNTPATTSPSRKPLSTRSQNTPLRPPPPPPKMTVLDTVTATAGAASASQARKKRSYISVNGKLFTRMDCIGRGGSAKVYRVMAENYKVFALKRVSLEDADELAIRGFKGEIQLLRKLENEERVIRLFDYEINDERQTLSILMEMGESDFSRLLNLRLNADNAVFDISFTRYFWKEMLECLQAVHQHDVVHSDLKPSNFLLVQGRLKLIDFGIANAIQDDTVNVHREVQIGTPNYMSPEALIDSNAVKGFPSTMGKVMKLGKPSDIWSLGCILYQMVYGKPPFAHLTNQLQRVMAIPDPNHVIQFPDTGVGGAPVPAGLQYTLRSCLNRNVAKRSTVEELLSANNPFLHPDTQIPRTVPVNEELIGRIQHSIIKHIQERGIPSEAELSLWPARYFASIKAAVEEGRA
jgi:serine/threonine-protein kinase TTK/MPS1